MENIKRYTDFNIEEIILDLYGIDTDYLTYTVMPIIDDLNFIKINIKFGVGWVMKHRLKIPNQLPGFKWAWNLFTLYESGKIDNDEYNDWKKFITDNELIESNFTAQAHIFFDTYNKPSVKELNDAIKIISAKATKMDILEKYSAVIDQNSDNMYAIKICGFNE